MPKLWLHFIWNKIKLYRNFFLLTCSASLTKCRHFLYKLSMCWEIFYERKLSYFLAAIFSTSFVLSPPVLRLGKQLILVNAIMHNNFVNIVADINASCSCHCRNGNDGASQSMDYPTFAGMESYTKRQNYATRWTTTTPPETAILISKHLSLKSNADRHPDASNRLITHQIKKLTKIYATIA